MNAPRITRHGIVRGLDTTLSSPEHEGRFGRMFRTLPKASFPDQALPKLGGAMLAQEEKNPTPETSPVPDNEENQGIHAGYTYLGQFIDHDLTFDPSSLQQQTNDQDALVDFRTPRFDLDNLYGRGPDDQPYLFDSSGMKFILGRSLTGSNLDPHTLDLQRNNPTDGVKRAIIGDPRNDENVIVSQIQGIFLRFHNKLVDMFPINTFSEIQQMVRWHYQWVLVNDFLPTIINKKTFDSIFPHITKKSNVHDHPPQIKFYHPKNDPYMPIEFSVAAYRFGHSMIRPQYRLNLTLPDTIAQGGRFAIFSTDPATSLTGFREFPSQWAIDWRLFFDFGNNANQFSRERIQPAYKIDTSLVNPLKDLPPSITHAPFNLALRNLQRGVKMGLPSGQAVAKKMGFKPLDDKDLRIGKATEEDFAKNQTLVSLDPAFKENAPLWFYILAEAAQQSFKKDGTPIRLGEVGGQIVGEVFAGILMGDHHSYFFQDPKWTPIKTFMNKNGQFGMAELISAAIA